MSEQVDNKEISLCQPSVSKEMDSISPTSIADFTTDEKADLDHASPMCTAAEQILKKFDSATLSWFHIKTIIIAGMGFFCDSYDLFSISLVTKLLGRIYYPDIAYFDPSTSACASFDQSSGCGSKFKPGLFVPSAMPSNISSALNGVALCGTLAGQLLFGYLGDRLGRRAVFGTTLIIMILFSIGSGLSYGSTSTGVITTLCLMRFFLGMGIGGDYPLSSTLMSEYSSRDNRGAFVAAVFAMQGVGILGATVVSMFVSYLFWTYGGDPDNIWRIIFMFGAIPTAVTMYARLKMPETPRYTLFVTGNSAQLIKDASVVMEDKPCNDNVTTKQQDTAVHTKRITFRQFFTQWRIVLFGTAGSWFLLDIAFYSQNLFQPDVFSTAGWLPSATTMSAAEEVFRIARAQFIIALCSTIPGYWFTVFTVERMGRWKIQMMGFFFMTVFMAILAGDYNDLKNNNVAGFVTLYALTFFFANWGPNATTFIVPAEVFPTQFRTTGHGVSAAFGKAGAIVGVFGFAASNTNLGLQFTLGILCAVNFLGLLTSCFVPETKGQSLEQLGKDQIVSSGVISVALSPLSASSSNLSECPA